MRSCSIVVMSIATLASHFPQADRNLISARLSSGQLYIARSSKATLNTSACLAIVFGFYEFIAHKSLRSVESQNS